MCMGTLHGNLSKQRRIPIKHGLDAVQNVIRQLRTPGYGKQLATIFLRTFQNASGMSLPLLQHPTIRAPHLEGHYYVHIRRFLAQHTASLEIECIPRPSYERQGDKYIMDVVCSPATVQELDKKFLRYYTDTEIRQIYYCKSYLNVQQISDLCTADGIFILSSIVKGERSIRQCASKLGTIRQERPGGNTWTTWKKFLNTLCKGTEERITNNQPSADSKKEEKIDRFSIGMIITKYWKGVPYKGEVIDNTNRYYKILYEDNDEEELNHKEVEQYMTKNRGDGRTIKEIGTRMRLKLKLGDWNKTAQASERLWPFYYSKKKDMLYMSYREEWHRQEEFNYDCHTRIYNIRKHKSAT
jgi:hypothetical protein